jgi:hypothetical protein
LEEEPSEDGQLTLKVPPTHDMLAAAQKHAESCFGSDSLTLEEVKKWTDRNPFVTAILCSQWGSYLGYFDILPLTDEGTNAFQSGAIEEREILASQILPPSEMRNARTLYVAGIAVKGHGTDIGRMRAAAMLSGLASYIVYFYGDSPRRIIAVAATESGTRVLHGADAQICCNAMNRKDRHDLYEVTFAPQLFERVISRTKRRADSPRIDSPTRPISTITPEMIVALKGTDVESYTKIMSLEDALRKCVSIELSRLTQNWWKERLPPDVNPNVRDRMAKEMVKEPWKREADLKPIDFLDFTEYEKIILRSDNWKEAFQPIFRNKDQLAMRLQELSALRNSIMHDRSLDWTEKEKVRIFTGEILRQIPIYEKPSVPVTEGRPSL